MIRPDWIFFDYGETLITEPRFDADEGNRAVLATARTNPRGVTVKDVRKIAAQINPMSRHLKDDLDVEAYSPSIQRLIYEILGVEFDISWERVDEIFWDNAAPGVAMPNVGELLKYLAGEGIRTAVISNMGFLSATLKRRIDRLIPENRFEFVMTSSEYFVRKPNPLIFRAALSQANLPAEDVWFCGDQIDADVYGAQAAGIFPVWYEETAIPNGFARKNTGLTIPGEHLHIHHWHELIAALD